MTATSASETLSSAAATIASMRSTVRAPRRELDLARLHRPAGDEDGRDVQPQRRHQHAGRDLVAIRNADQGVGAMGVGHVFDAVGDHLARGQRIEHAVVSHRDAVVDRDGVELLGDAARRLDLAGDQLAEVLQMDVAGHELGEGIGDGDDRLAEIAVLHAGGAPEAARARHVAAMRRGAGAIGGHWGPCQENGSATSALEARIVAFSGRRQQERSGRRRRGGAGCVVWHGESDSKGLSTKNCRCVAVAAKRGAPAETNAIVVETVAAAPGIIHYIHAYIRTS